jgi:PKD repeat protein
LYSAATTAVAPTITAAFTLSTGSNVGPVTGTFTNTSTNTALASIYRWDLGDGSPIETTIIPNPHVYETGSFTASLSITSSHYSNIKSLVTYSFTIVVPTLTALFTVDTGSGIAPVTVSFVNSSAYDGTGTYTYFFDYGTGSLTTDNGGLPAIVYENAGGYTASLYFTADKYQLTSSTYTQSFVLA